MQKKVYVILKRIFDFIIAMILLLILVIPFIVIAICIKLEDGGTVFFKQKRVGKNLKEFDIYKFRSMKVEREQLNSDLSHDEMVTKIGKILRKTSIDELPQLFNVLKGEMSFIGPRPWIPDYYVYFTDEQKRRSNVLPGISGLAQVKGRNEIDIFQKIKYDLEYVDNIGLGMDLKIIGLTIAEVLKKTGADASEAGIKSEIEQLKNKNSKYRSI